jgi:hypothetical protein
MFPSRVPMEKDNPFPEPMINLFINVDWIPQKKEPPTKWGKT